VQTTANVTVPLEIEKLALLKHRTSHLVWSKEETTATEPAAGVDCDCDTFLALNVVKRSLQRTSLLAAGVLRGPFAIPVFRYAPRSEAT
jgi:hypothetical protein